MALCLDISSAMVRHMNEESARLKLPNYRARVVGPDDPGLDPGSVDVIFLCNTFHHIEGRPVYFRNVASALKPGGRVVIVDFYEHSPVGPQEPGHKLAMKTALSDMKEAGYRLIKSHTLLPHQYFLEFVFNK